MIQQLTNLLNYGIFAELALAIFVMVFIAIVIRTLMTRQEQTREQASIVLNDQEKKQT